MHVLTPLTAPSVLRPPAPSARCTCSHWSHCDCACHSTACDPAADACDLAYRPDDGGLTPSGCASCTPGEGLPHADGCELIGWHVPLDGASPSGSVGLAQVPLLFQAED